MAESAEAAQKRIEAEHLSRQAVRPQDEGPHSRACGISPHSHGQFCHPNCPTCGGKPLPIKGVAPAMLMPGKAQEILDSLLPGEPVFVFRAKDILSSFALEAYLTMVEKFAHNGPQAASLVEAINRFREWQTSHPNDVKLPD